MAKSLYITYDGLLEPLGQSQVWQYLRRLSAKHEIVLLSFEKRKDFEDKRRMLAMRAECSRFGIHWIPRVYHRKPSALATSYDIVAGVIVGLWAVRRYRIDLVHARSYVSSVMALVLKKLTGVRFIFDMRGFWADERVDGLWPKDGLLFRIAKRFERWFLLHADIVVSLTEVAVAEMKQFDYLRGIPVRFEVVPTCADLSMFVPRQSERRGDAPFTLGYVGSVSVWHLFDEVVQAFKALRELEPNSRLLVVNRGGHGLVRAALERAGIDVANVELVEADHSEVPKLIQRMDAAAFFIKPSYSKIGSAPTKFAEMLGVGIPVLTNGGVGDMEALVINHGEPVGVIVKDFSMNSQRVAVAALLRLVEESGICARCRTLAERYFSADLGSERYSLMYTDLEAR